MEKKVIKIEKALDIVDVAVEEHLGNFAVENEKISFSRNKRDSTSVLKVFSLIYYASIPSYDNNAVYLATIKLRKLADASIELQIAESQHYGIDHLRNHFEHRRTHAISINGVPETRANTKEEDIKKALSVIDDVLAIRMDIIEELLRRLESDGMFSETPTLLINKKIVGTFVDLNRMAQLKNVRDTNFDLMRLNQLCKELNDCYTSESYLAVAMILRTILNHIPPIFGYKTFSEFTNNYGGERNNKSLKKSMRNLDKSLKNIADRHLHQPIRQKESLPSHTQVDFRQDLDVLLEEIVRVLKE